RLHDYLGYKTPKQIIDFLGDNHKVLSRYQLTKEGTSDDPKKKYELKENFDDQFPVFLPVGKEGEEKLLANILVRASVPPDGPRIPTFREEVGNDFDNFAGSMLWYIYAQEPLPDFDPDFGVTGRTYDPGKHRRSK